MSTRILSQLIEKTKDRSYIIDAFRGENTTAEKAITYAPSRLAFAARYILPLTIFDALDRTSPGKSGELQLTNGILLLLKEGTLGYSIKLTDKEKRYNITRIIF